MATATIQEKLHKAFDALKAGFAYRNRMETPRVEKVVISTGTGKIQDKAKIELIQDRLARITGQKAAPRGAKKSIASFKIREGDVIGFQATLRGRRMRDFLDRLIHVALPRTKDFHGLKRSSIDEMGNYTFGISEHTIFPETSDEDIKDVFGLSVTIVTTATTKKEAEALLEHIGIPLERTETAEQQ